MQDKILRKYIAKSHAGNVFSDSELKAIRQGDTEELVDTFLDLNNDYYKTQVQCTLKSLGLFMNSDLELDNVAYENGYKGQFVGCQIMDGDIDVFLGVAGDNVQLLKVASAFAQEELEEFDADAYDALCELINVINGAYATKLGDKNIEVTLHPPVFYKNIEVEAEKGFYIMSFKMSDNGFKVIMAADDKIKLIA